MFMIIEALHASCHRAGFEEFIKAKAKPPDFIPQKTLGQDISGLESIKRLANKMAYLWIEDDAGMWFLVSEVDNEVITGYAWVFGEWVQAILTSKSIKKFMCVCDGSLD